MIVGSRGRENQWFVLADCTNLVCRCPCLSMNDSKFSKGSLDCGHRKICNKRSIHAALRIWVSILWWSCWGVGSNCGRRVCLRGMWVGEDAQNR